MRASRGAAAVAILALALLASSCGDDDEAPLAPQAPGDTTTTTSMLSVAGEAHVSVAMDVGLTELASADPVGGTFRAVIEDSTGFRVFLPDVHLNGASFVEERDQFGNPSQITMDVDQALPGLALEDSLLFVVDDGGAHTAPFSIRMKASRVELLPDSTVVSKGQAIRFRWHGRIERLILTLTDQFGERVRANLTFENYSGLREVTFEARDLEVLAPGPLAVSASIADSEARFAGPRLISLVYTGTQRRNWTLVP